MDHYHRLTSSARLPFSGNDARHPNNFIVQHVEDVMTDLIYQDTCNILDVGCGYGALARYLKQSYGRKVHVHGIEPNPQKAAIASLFADEISEMMLGEFLGLDPDGSLYLKKYKIVIMGDVLEHMYDPWKALHDMCQVLCVGTIVIVSIPCITNIFSLHHLISSQFDYQESGIFDFTHTRFFGPQTALALLRQQSSRLHITKITRNICPDSIQLVQQAKADINSHSIPLGKGLRLQLGSSIDSDAAQDLITRAIVVTSTVI